MSKGKYDAKLKEIDDADARFTAEIAALEKQLEDKRQEYDATIARLYAERDEIAMEIKLQAFPKKLRDEHQTCSVCGEPMRPFAVARQDGTVQKIWACAAGNLSETHDLFPVE